MRARDLPRNAVLAIRNFLRSLRRDKLDWIVLPLHGSYPERTARRDPLPFPFNRLSLFPSEVSLEDMRGRLETIGNDRRVRGVVLRFDTLRAGPSALYSLRRMLLDLRAQGKRVIAWLPSASTWDYYLASACDEVVLPQPTRLLALGLRAEPVFLKDTLALAGVEADLEAIAEYKVSPDTFRRSTMSEPHQEMLDSLLDSLFEELIAAIAEERGVQPARVRQLIDAMPLTPMEAVEAELIDAVLYEDELRSYVSDEKHPEPENEGDDSSCVSLLSWQEAAHWLRQPIKWSTQQIIAVVSLEGLIVPGQSRRIPLPVPLPFPERQAGAETIGQVLRCAEADKRVAAVILYVETPGGSALASDLICHEIRRLGKRKPVVALMGGQATSGGYYVAAGANRIVARPTTLTGSIGIWGGKFVLTELYGKLEVGRESVHRGAMADLYSEMRPFNLEEREWIRHDLGEAYTRFKTRVAEGRGMTDEQVEKVARGRVWTGEQALEIGLVDALGDFETALAIAKELAGLKPEREYTVSPIHPPRHAIYPLPLSEEQSLIGVGSLIEALRALAGERVWALAPWVVQVR